MYRELKKSYIIFLCLSDPFDRGLPVYSFRNACIQDPELELGDDTHKVIVNADGRRDGLSKEMCDFLDYLQKKGANSGFTQKLQSAVDDAIKHRNWEVEYMTINLKLMEEREEGRKEGRKEGRADIIQRMLKSGMTSEEIHSQIGIPLEEILSVADSMCVNA